MFEQIKRLGTHVVIYGFGNAGTRIVGFLLIPLYSRFLTPEDYGVLALVSMFGQLLYTVTNMGQSGALFRTYLLHDDPGARDTVITTSLWLIMVLSFPVGLLALALAKPTGWLLSGSSAYTSWVVLGVAGVMFKTLLRLPLSVLRAKEKSRRYSVATCAQTIITIVLAILFVVGLHLGGRGVLLSQLVAEILLCVWLLPGMLKGLRLTFSRRDARDLLGYGLAITPAPVLSFLLHLSDRYILRHFASVGVVGVYALGYRFGEILYFVILAFELAYPQFLFAHLKNPDAPKLYARVCTYYVAVAGSAWLAVSLFAEPAVKIMAHAAYHDAYRVIPWIAGAYLLQGIGWVCSIGLGVHKLVRYRLMISATAVVSNLGLNLWLIPQYGLMGAAVAALASLVVQCTLQIVVGYRVFPVPYEIGRIARLAAVGAGVYAVGNLVDWGSLTAAIAGKTLLLAMAPLLLYATGFFERGEVTRARDLVSGFRQRSAAVAQPRGSGK
jgi:O-antigen/teichoic acid export membrane protein